ncbi:glutathione S-transferase-like [Rhododendron vialii]|uniref:glutathione S-transferase-like n=1 Tax=Rhododendron vialii TaxID=182163 RepID=UPI00265E094A|nr:glutathione S-transferase-like [Rhododendron vialii]
MAARKLYGAVESRATMRALASLLEHEVEFEFVALDLNAGEHKKEPFLTLSPLGTLPIFQDGDLIIFGSRPIMRCVSHIYLNSKTNQIYMAPKMQGIVSTWIDVEDHHFDPPALKLISELVYKPKNGLPPDEMTVASEEAKLAEVLDVYEEKLTNSEFLGGDKFTSADLTHLPSLHYLMRTPVKRIFQERPKVSAWCAAITSRPAWTKVVEKY